MQDLIILSKDTVVAKYIENKFEIVCSNLIPLYLKRTENLEKWLEERAIDSHRTNSRLLKRMLRLQEKTMLIRYWQSMQQLLLTHTG